MTRIIAGRAGGTSLEVPDSGTRPTSDRVRESLFGALESWGALDSARVADLYAGSGALGLEAVSRGAASLDLVEKAGRAATIAERNAARVAKAMGNTIPVVRVHRVAVSVFVSRAAGPYDLVFLDPPYDLAEAELSEALAALARLLSPDALVVVERGRHSPAPAWAAAGLEALRDRRYGDTIVWWGQPRDASQSR